MKYILTIFILFFFCTCAFAAAKDMRISDGDGHVLDIDSSGNLQISTTNGAIVKTSGAKDRRISDNDGHVLKINSDGTVTINFGSPS